VILITTKSGRKESPLEIGLDFKVSVSEVAKTVDVLSADEFRSFVTENGTEEQVALLGNANTDWQDEIFQTGVGTITNFTLSKGFKSTTIRTSFNHTDQEGVLKTDTFRKNTFSTVITQDLFDNNLKLRLSTKLNDTRNRFANNGAIGNALRFDPTQAIRNTEGSFFEFSDVNAPLNPVGNLEQDTNRGKSQRLITNFSADYKIPFVPGLKFTMNLGVDYAENSGRQFQEGNSGLTRGRRDPSAPFINDYSGFNRNQLIDALFNYKKEITAIKTKVDATVGYSFQEFLRKNSTQNTINNEQLAAIRSVNRNNLLSYFGRLNLEIADKYLISGSLRRDAASRFSSDLRNAIFPGVSVGWKLHNEKLFQNINSLSQLKIRAGWGLTGQQEIDNSFPFLPIFLPGQDQARVQFGNEFVNTLRPGEFNVALKWEETINKNIGLDFGFFNGRLSGSVDLYTKETKDLLVEAPGAAGSNLTDRFFQNVAETTSKGVEFGINGDIFRNEDFNWNLAYNITYNQIEIDKLSGRFDPNIQIPRGGIAGGVGNNIQVWKPGFDPTTFLVQRQIFDANGRPIEGAVIDVNGDNQITDADLVPYKKATPDVFMGLTSTFNYQDLDFSFTFRGSFGGYNYNNVRSELANQASSLNTPGNFVNNTHQDVLSTNFVGQQLFSDYYLERSDFVRLDNISVGYTFNFEKVKLRVSATGSNLWTITDYSGIDPEVLVDNNPGIDNNSYPRPRNYVLGVNVKF